MRQGSKVEAEVDFVRSDVFIILLCLSISTVNIACCGDLRLVGIVWLRSSTIGNLVVADAEDISI